MVFSVSAKIEINKIKGANEYKIKYIISEDGNDNKYVALIVNKDLEYPIVYDNICDEIILKYNWYIHHMGYAFNATANYMHICIAKNNKISDYDNEKLSVDHISREKLDNRIKNLRMATRGQQNSNRDTRSDKKPPSQELVEAGITELPKYIRWDKSEKKFVIDKHPHLVNEVTQGIRKRPEMSGTKSYKLTIIQKYQDILARLEEFDNEYLNNSELNTMRIQNKKEYDEICKCIKIYEGIEIEEKSDSETSNKSVPIISKRNTAAGRKTVSKLPEDCGVKVEDIPKYCYYKAATEKRGDKFIIDKHPKLVEQGKNQWGTTESSKKTTLEKFNMLMEKYTELST
jgi:hypothetical protein